MVKNVAYDMIDKNKRFFALDSEMNECAAVEFDDDRAALKQALRGLDGNEFKIVTMFYFYGYKIKEISGYIWGDFSYGSQNAAVNNMFVNLYNMMGTNSSGGTTVDGFKSGMA